MTAKRFDAIAMKRRGSEAVLANIAHMTLEEELAYWQERTRQLDQRILEAKRAFAEADEQEKRMTITERLARAGYTGGRLFKTGEEVDAYIREERDSWER